VNEVGSRMLRYMRGELHIQSNRRTSGKRISEEYWDEDDNNEEE